MKKSIVFYLDEYMLVKHFSHRDFSILYRALFEYALTENVPELPKHLVVAFNFMAYHMKRDMMKYEEVSNKRSNAGKKSAESRKNAKKQNNNSAPTVSESDSAECSEVAKKKTSGKKSVDESESDSAECSEVAKKKTSGKKSVDAETVSVSEECSEVAKKKPSRKKSVDAETVSDSGEDVVKSLCSGDSLAVSVSGKDVVKSLCSGESLAVSVSGKDVVKSLCSGDSLAVSDSGKDVVKSLCSGESLAVSDSEKNSGRNKKEAPNSDSCVAHGKNCGNEQIIEHFNELWALYPKKYNKENAKREYIKLNPDENLRKRMINAVKKFRSSEDWTKNNGQYIPLCSNWIINKRWEDTENSNTCDDSFDVQEFFEAALRKSERTSLSGKDGT